MIKLTQPNGDYITINPDLVTSVRPGERPEYTIVVSNGEGNVVQESWEEVTRKILEYKLAMVRYGESSKIAYECYAESKNNPYTPPLDQVQIINKLAGLEG